MAALDRLTERIEDPQPRLQEIGEDIMERIKQRFQSSTGPDGQPWKENRPSTIARYIQSRGGFGKTGLNRKGRLLAGSKKPLQGQTGDLARQFHVDADNHSVTIASSPKYAAMQQFGGTRAQFPNLWGDIPARPFFPITASGEVTPAEREMIVEAIAGYIQGGVA